MAKRRTGLQSAISSIFSGVPVPKKGGSGSEPAGPAPKPDGSGPPRPVVPQLKAPQAPGAAAPAFRPPVEPVREIPPAKVPVRVVPEQKIRQVPDKIPRRKKDRPLAAGTSASSARQKVAIAMVIILSIILVVVLVRPSRTPRPGSNVSGVAGQAVAGVPRRANISIDWPVPSVYPENFRDPMVLGSQRQSTTGTSDVLTVKGITYSDDRKYAVIGTQTVQEGDTVQGTQIKIKKINPNSVEFEQDGKTWTQPVRREES